MRPRLGVSSCLLGEQVRFDGGHRRHSFLTDVLGPHVDLVPFCPEMAIGLGAPRETLRLTAADHLINRSGTADHTAAVAALPLPVAIDGYVFKAKSPSCGIHGIPRYPGQADQEQPADRRGRGVYAGRVMAAFPLLPVEDEGRLSDAGLREAFTERIFARARLRELFVPGWQPRDLVAFHARHKLQILSRDPARYRLAGRLVAEAGGRPRAEAEACYTELFCAALTGKATRGRHANALLHAFSQVSELLDDTRRADIVERIEAYRRGQAPIGVPIALLTHHACGDGLDWLAEQTYLAPYPEELRPAR
jgi:uncharacterized protein YbgA (DUF1722 family)/uncharacterized protein YbbK (DUF523 family)